MPGQIKEQNKRSLNKGLFVERVNSSEKDIESIQMSAEQVKVIASHYYGNGKNIKIYKNGETQKSQELIKKRQEPLEKELLEYKEPLKKYPLREILGHKVPIYNVPERFQIFRA